MFPRSRSEWIKTTGSLTLILAIGALNIVSVAQAGDNSSKAMSAKKRVTAAPKNTAKSTSKNGGKSTAKSALQIVSKPGVKPVVKTARPTPAKPASAKPTAPASKPAPAKSDAPSAQPVTPVASIASKVTVNEGGTKVMEEKISKTMITFKMVRLPGGTITMPDAKAPGGSKEVAIKPFWIGEKEVSWDEYDAYMFKLDMTDAEAAKVDVKLRPSLPYGAPDRGYGHEGYPAISIARNGAEQYCKWLSNKTGKKYRLPTEAEWEFAARAGGDVQMKPEELQSVAWVQENSNDTTHPLGEKKANAWGLYDMLGNAGEWVQGYDGDWVLKGGSFKETAAKVNAQWRAKQINAWHDPNKPKSNWWLADGPFAGFRVLCED
ncbi:MAG TPA: SUMF1/EgtB/PvdO family nonheme iron enzyme [Abditibacteriaceae bacterium]|jgi:formylglycine-generating enzyme required for sulfatase activity